MFLFSSLLLATTQRLIPKEYTQIMSDIPTNRMISTLRAQPVIVPINVSSSESVISTYGYFSSNDDDIQSSNDDNSKAEQFGFGRLASILSMPSFLSKSLTSTLKPATNNLPIVLLHGFDSSCLEFRKLAPLLAEATNCQVYAPDILGWGFSDHSNVTSFTPEAKVQHLASFLKQVVKKPCVVVGASLVSSCCCI